LLLYAATKSFTRSTASLLLMTNDSQTRTTALVVNDCWRCDSRTLDVATEAETEADTDARYAGAIAVSAFGAPSMTVVHPTTASAIIATQPTARAALCHPSLPIATGGDVTG